MIMRETSTTSYRVVISLKETLRPGMVMREISTTSYRVVISLKETLKQGMEYKISKTLLSDNGRNQY